MGKNEIADGALPSPVELGQFRSIARCFLQRRSKPAEHGVLVFSRVRSRQPRSIGHEPSLRRHKPIEKSGNARKEVRAGIMDKTMKV